MSSIQGACATVQEDIVTMWLTGLEVHAQALALNAGRD